MQAEGVEAVVEAASLSVVGLVEVAVHIPRIYNELRKLKRVAAAWRPDLAILTDSPDFHLPLAAYLKKLGVPVVYLIAPQVWAWRQGRVKKMRQIIDLLLCIFPFEEPWFRDREVNARYIGHPLAGRVRALLDRRQFFDSMGIPDDKPLVALLPGSRAGEVARHGPLLVQAVERIRARRDCSFAMALAPGLKPEAAPPTFWELISAASIHKIEGHRSESKAGAGLEGSGRGAAASWNLLAHCDVALAASGTVTIEGALLGAPMVTYYRVNALSWFLGRRLVRVPHLSMVNLVAGRRLVPEFMQDEATPENLAEAVLRLLEHPEERARMGAGLLEVAAALGGVADPMDEAVRNIEGLLAKERSNVA
jgi:lipid-A-disaccharide synthase